MNCTGSMKRGENMKQLLNTLYVMTQGSYLSLDHDTLRVEVDGTKNHVPLHHLGGIVAFGNVMMTPFLIHRCAEDGRSIVLMDKRGRFKARLVGSTKGNVFLRQAQYDTLKDEAATASIARNIAAGKLRNSRSVLLRGAREAYSPESAEALRNGAAVIANAVTRLESAGLEETGGLEGESARAYFGALKHMVLKDPGNFTMNTRTRRPPMDPMNALLSYLYSMLLHDCISALEGVGLDPQVGFLHCVRPGRPALGLDLMEEFRSIVADRLALTLVNRGQLTITDFIYKEGMSVYLDDSGRKTVSVAYQKKKQEETAHPLFEGKVPIGLLPHIQARLLARYLRGDLEGYPPYLMS